MRLTLASFKAIKYACLNFHYAKSVPSIKYGFNVYNENDEWCGVICYGNSATPNIGKPYRLCQGEILELVRVALNGKQKTTSECVSGSLRELHKISPILKMVISYADLDEGHVGTIYQASNWIYLGVKNAGNRGAFIINGKKTHPRTIGSMGGVQSLKWVKENLDQNAQEFFTKGKHLYIYCFDKKLRKEWVEKRQPYPKNDRK